MLFWPKPTTSNGAEPGGGRANGMRNERHPSSCTICRPAMLGGSSQPNQLDLKTEKHLTRSMWLLLTAVVAAAAVVRFWGIGFGLPYSQARPDESFIIDT